MGRGENIGKDRRGKEKTGNKIVGQDNAVRTGEDRQFRIEHDREEIKGWEMKGQERNKLEWGRKLECV